ncbi:MAG TPA: SpoIIE family protein phosphatase [Ignavibacteria bacterium]|nr:SpoIIE family protein phosphatase [Ignavibacteria bacterium]HMR39896.1 SpoIIE family protein phosphatase [Ignavibacteria bacterium]
MKELNSTYEIQDIIQEMNYLHEISQRISEMKSLDQLLNEIIESCKEVLKAEASSLLIYDEELNELYFEIATGEKGEQVIKKSFKMGEGIAGWVAEHREPLLIEDCYKDPRFNKEFDIKSNFRTKSMICVPMIRKEKLIGVIQVINKKGDQIFSERDLNIFSILASQCAISIENARLTEIQIQQKSMERELKTARAIQQNLLPSKLPDFKDLDVYFTLIPAKQVGGDYYNVYKISDDLTLFFICDVSGKSISAALIVSTICSCIMTYLNLLKISEEKFDLKELVKSLNSVLIESTTEEKFATCWFGLFRHSDKKFTSINAGHNVTYLFRENEIIELKEGGLFLGSIDMDFNSEEIQLQKNNQILCYTDGVPEATDKDFNFFGDDELIVSASKNLKEGPETIVNTILNDLRNFVNGAEQSDDITCGVIKVL